MSLSAALMTRLDQRSADATRSVAARSRWRAARPLSPDWRPIGYEAELFRERSSGLPACGVAI